MKPLLTDEEIEQVIESLDTAHSRCREIERLTRERMAARIEKLEAVVAAAQRVIRHVSSGDGYDYYREQETSVWGHSSGGLWSPFPDDMQPAVRAAIAAEHGEEGR